MPYKEKQSKVLMPFVEESFLISKRIISNARMNRYAKTGSPWKTPFSRLKYFI